MEKNTVKNNAKSAFETYQIDDDFVLLIAQNETEEGQNYYKSVAANMIQFHFCLKGQANYRFNEGRYSRNLAEDSALFLFNPQQELPIDLAVDPYSWTVSLLVPIRKFHALFSGDTSYIDFLKDDQIDKKYYKELALSPAMTVVLSQILNLKLHHSVRSIYLKGKILELIGLFFNPQDEVNVEQCPFLVDEENVRKLKKAKEIMTTNMANPPSLKELSEEIGLGLKKLKQGFKEVYGETVYGFLLNYKLDYAQKLLETGQYNVNEVGLQIGYSTASHFISAFKKKFGTTPKKYIQSMNTR